MKEKVWAVLGHRFFLLFVRIVIGAIFVLSGTIKIVEGPQEFALVIRDYQLLPKAFVLPIATALPWLELFSGTFFIVGYLPRLSLAIVLALLLLFVGAISSTLARGISLEDCGCFGGIIKETPKVVLIRDIIFIALVVPLFIKRYLPTRWPKTEEDEDTTAV